MPRPSKRALAEMDANAHRSSGEKSSKVRKEEKAVVVDEDGANKNNSEPDEKAPKYEYVTICPPSWDREAQKGEDEDEDEDEEEEVDDDDDHGEECVCNQPLEKQPDWSWRITKAGLKIVKQTQKEVMKRDQDLYGLHVYNDFTGYGLQEVIENHLVGINQEISRRKTMVPLSLWSKMEGMAMLTMDIDAWFMIDDADTCIRTVSLIGVGLLTTLTVLKTHDLLKRDSPMVNIPLIVSLFLKFAEQWQEIGNGQGEADWEKAAVKMLDDNGGLWETDAVANGTKEIIKKIREEMSEDDDDDDQEEAKNKDKKTWAPEDDKEGGEEEGVRQWHHWDWKVEYKIFCENQGKVPQSAIVRGRRGGRGRGRGGMISAQPRVKPVIGGQHFDLTKMGKASKKKYGY